MDLNDLALLLVKKCIPGTHHADIDFFFLAALSAESPLVGDFVANSELDTGALPSVRLCVGLVMGLFICLASKIVFYGC
jgi:hypothetical protein